MLVDRKSRASGPIKKARLHRGFPHKHRLPCSFHLRAVNMPSLKPFLTFDVGDQPPRFQWQLEHRRSSSAIWSRFSLLFGSTILDYRSFVNDASMYALSSGPEIITSRAPAQRPRGRK